MSMSCMLDLETLGNRPGSPVIAIGAVAFDPDVAFMDFPQDTYRTIGDYWLTQVLRVEDDVFYSKVKMSAWDGHMDKVGGDTLAFWFLQSDAARREMAVESPATNSCGVPGMLRAFSFFFTKDRLNLTGKPDDPPYQKIKALWSKPATYDTPMLAEAYETFGMQPPWDHRSTRCAKTEYIEAGVDEKQYNYGTLHKADCDAINQTAALLTALRFRKMGIA